QNNLDMAHRDLAGWTMPMVCYWAGATVSCVQNTWTQITAFYFGFPASWALDPSDGTLIAEGLIPPVAGYTWEPTQVKSGTYYVYARADDLRNLPVVVYAPEPVHIENIQPPSAPVRPYLSSAGSSSAPKPAPVMGKVPAPQAYPLQDSALAQRIRTAVNARLGNQIDSQLLDTIIRRVLASTGLK
ncbi:MAG: hypothetical protein HGA71_20865, partial [Azonexaceae bacterium]|nr:hypothetical protein [Azonexaceae bacterium]